MQNSLIFIHNPYLFHVWFVQIPLQFHPRLIYLSCMIRICFMYVPYTKKKGSLFIYESGHFPYTFHVQILTWYFMYESHTDFRVWFIYDRSVWVMPWLSCKFELFPLTGQNFGSTTYFFIKFGGNMQGYLLNTYANLEEMFFSRNKVTAIFQRDCLIFAQHEG